MGPVEYLVVEFPGNQFNGDVVPALKELTRNGTIHIIDLIFVKKDGDGNVKSFELSNLSAAEAAAFNDLDGEIDDLLNEEDILLAAEKLQPNSAGAILVFEHTWAIRLRDAVVNSGGRLVENDRISNPVVDAAFAAARGGTN
jgi:hypothetical protein